MSAKRAISKFVKDNRKLRKFELCFNMQGKQTTSPGAP